MQDGLPDISQFSPEQRQALMAQLEAMNVASLPIAVATSQLPQATQVVVNQSIVNNFATANLSEEDAIHLGNYLRALRDRLLPLALGDLDIWQAVDTQSGLDLHDLFTEGKVDWRLECLRRPRDGVMVWTEPGDPDRQRAISDAEAKARTYEGPDEQDLGDWLLDYRQVSSSRFAAIHPRAVILGAPGSGKSSFLNMLALYLAGEHLADSQLHLGLLPDWRDAGGPIWLPLIVTLREFAGSPLSLWDFLVDRLPAASRDAQKATLHRVLSKQGALLLLDGLDEVPQSGQYQARFQDAIIEFRAAFPRARVLVTSRTYAYERDGWALKGFTAARLLDFEALERSTFLRRWFNHAAPKRGLRPVEAETRRERLETAIEGREHLRQLAENPLLLTLICLHDFQSHGKVPENREELYEKSVDLLLELWQRPKLIDPANRQPYARLENYLGVTRQELQKKLEELALKFHRRQGAEGGLADIPDGELLLALDELARAARGQRLEGNIAVSLDSIRHYVEDRAGILTHHGSVYRFAHRTFQEYLAARALSDLGAAKLLAQVREEPRTLWREVFLLAGAKLKKGSLDSLWRLLGKTVPELPGNLSSISDTDWRMAALAARLLLEAQGPLTGLDADDDAVLDRVRRWLVAMIACEALPLLEERISAAMDLGWLGDPRPGVGLDHATGLPDILWVPISTGAFVFLGKPAEIETPYEIVAYPVTVAQYQAFVADGGYLDNQWWRGQDQGIGAWDGCRWRENHAYTEDFGKSYEVPNLPQTGIIWYEAMAYCQWLGKKTGRSIRLPTEREWERAAVGPGGTPRFLPWGGSPEDSDDEVSRNCNIGPTKIGHPTPVGLFPSGDAREGPYRISDLSGNAWEWTSSSEGRDGCVLRGGSFDRNRKLVHASICLHNQPDDGNGSLGFRLVSS